MVHTFLLSLNAHYFSIRMPAILSYDFLDRSLFLFKNNNFNVSWVLANLYCFLILCAGNVCDTSAKSNGAQVPFKSTTHSLQQESIPVGCVPPVRATQATRCQHQKGSGVYGPGGWGYGLNPPLPGQNDTRLWKHYLPATSLAGGNNPWFRIWHNNTTLALR